MNDKLVYSYIDEIGKRLSDPDKFGAASLMIGAGFSKNAECVGEQKDTPPEWEELAETMYEELYPFDKSNEKRRIKECSGKNVLTLAQKYEVTFDRQSLNSLIEKSIADSDYVPGDLHRALVELNWNDIFTTNYDTLLERAIGQVATKRKYKIVYSQKDLPGSVRPRLIKLHGSINHSSQYIITEEDYRTYPDKYAPFVNTVHQSMLETRLCLIGFSGSDPNFLNWLGWLRDSMGENCLSIYLCGVFDELGTAERKMLEQRHIIVVDLSVLLDGETENIHYVALKKFLSLLKEKGEKTKEEILGKKPYSNVVPWDFHSTIDMNKYIKEMYALGKNIIQKIEDYICVPKKDADNIGEYINKHLEFILNKEDFKEKPFMVDLFCSILKKCNLPLFENNAKKLKKIIECTELENVLNIVFYLMQMYRIDGNFEEYLQIKSVVDNIEFTGVKKRNEYLIECTKFHMCTLETDKAYELLKSMKILKYDEYALKKASLLNQLNKKNEAKEIITNTVAYISQQRYSENKNASLIGYANLVARGSWSRFDGQELFSDSLYENNLFNSRRIVNESKETIIEVIFENQQPQNCKTKSFNPNTYTINYTIGNTGSEKKVIASLKYLLLQDLLCIGIYTNHQNATLEAVKLIDNTSDSPLWRWYHILRAKDKKIYNLYFTRERIYRTETKYVINFYDGLLLLLEKSVNNAENFLGIECRSLVGVLSRLTIVLDGDRIIKLLEILIKIDERFEDKVEKGSIINDSLKIIQYNFNVAIFNKCYKFILDNKLLDYGFTAYFLDNNIIMADRETLLQNEMINSISSELDSENLDIRDNAVIKYRIFKKQILTSNRAEEIEDKLWGQLDEFGLPLNKSFLATEWLEDEQHNVEENILKYLLHPQFSSNYINGMISGDNEGKYQIFKYNNVLYTMMNKKKLLFTKEQLLELIDFMSAYAKNESKIVDNKYDFMGEISQAKERLVLLNNIILLLCVNAKVSKNCDKKFKLKIDEYVQLMEAIQIDVENIKIIFSDFSLNEFFKKFEKMILSGNDVHIASAFMMLYGAMLIMQSQGENQEIDELVLIFIQKIPYFEISIGKRVILELPNIVCRESFLKEENCKCLIDMLNDSYAIYEKIQEDSRKDGLDGMYNISNLAKKYYQFINEKNVKIDLELENLIDKFRACKLNEIRFKWL